MSILEKAYFKLYKCVETCYGGHTPDAVHSLLLSFPMGFGFRVVGQRPYVNRIGSVKDIEIQLQRMFLLMVHWPTKSERRAWEVFAMSRVPQGTVGLL